MYFYTYSLKEDELLKWVYVLVVIGQERVKQERKDKSVS